MLTQNFGGKNKEYYGFFYTGVDTTAARAVKYSCTQTSMCPGLRNGRLQTEQVLAGRGQITFISTEGHIRIGQRAYFGVIENVRSRGFDHGGHGGVPVETEIDRKTVVFFPFRKARSAVRVILACEAREPPKLGGTNACEASVPILPRRFHTRSKPSTFHSNIDRVARVRKKYDCFAV